MKINCGSVLNSCGLIYYSWQVPAIKGRYLTLHVIALSDSGRVAFGLGEAYKNKANFSQQLIANFLEG